jgi:PAS domain-containing protein
MRDRFTASCNNMRATSSSRSIARARSPFWNDGAERLLGFPRARALGARLDLIIPPHLRERHWAGFKHALAAGASLAPDWVKTPVLRADGTIIRMAIPCCC